MFSITEPSIGWDGTYILIKEQMHLLELIFIVYDVGIIARNGIKSQG